MDSKPFLSNYTQSSWVQNLEEILKRAHTGYSLCLKGMIGSLDAVIVASIYSKIKQNHLIITKDHDEAYYFQNNLKNLLNKNISLYTHLENYSFDPSRLDISRISRNEVFTNLAIKDSHSLIVTYPEALIHKNLSKEILLKNTFTISREEDSNLLDLESKLLDIGFIKTEFVYAPGEYALRGGILDVYSFSHILPYRIEFVFNKIEDIRVFNPENQCALYSVEKMSILPKQNSTGIDSQKYNSILETLPTQSFVWIKDYDMITSTIEKSHIKEHLDSETNANFAISLSRHISIEFGNRFYLKHSHSITYNSTHQTNFKQNIPLLIDALEKDENKAMKSIIVAETQLQLDRVEDILNNNIPDKKNITFLQLGLSEAYIDNELHLAIYTDHQIFDRFYRPKVTSNYSKNKALTFKELQNLEMGDYVVHSDFGIGKFAGLAKRSSNGNKQEAIRLLYKDNDTVYVGLQSLHKISKYKGKEGISPTISKLGSPTWDQKKQKVKARVKDIAKDLILLYCKRRESPGFAFNADTTKQIELESSFIYEDTPDQISATKAIKADMESPHPMDRLVCGDVGFGKTEVAIRAVFKAVNSKKQVAVLVPTTILALQHYNSFSNRLSKFNISVEYISRFKSPKQVKETLERVSQGKVDVLIGTHKILNKSIEFKDLGLLVIDEEQKFGVSAKERIKELKVNLDILTLTATPIPRTMHFSLMGAKDLSIINTAPKNRQPIQTFINTFDKQMIADAINKEYLRGGQVIFVHNKVANIETMASLIKSLVPHCTLDIIHGQMPPHKIEKSIIDFTEQKTHILLATSIVESGVDIPNANTLIVNDSHKFGLSDLHQMRGRVGRSSQKAYCYLIAPPSSEMSAVARRRLSALEEFSDLGDGFKIAMRDLDIRGAGDLLGAEQSGFIADIGFDTYCQILDEAVTELKINEFKDVFGTNNDYKRKTINCNLESDFEALIPEDYVSNITERIHLYTRLDTLKVDAEVDSLLHELKDRFGEIPTPVKNLIDLIKIRWHAQKIGINELYLLNGTMKSVFLKENLDKSEQLDNIIRYVQNHSKSSSLNASSNQLILKIDKITCIENAERVLELLDGLFKAG